MSIALYALSLSQIAFCLDPKDIQGNPSNDCYHGWAALVWGWLGLTGGAANLIWLANPVLYFAWLLVPSGIRVLSVPFCVIAVATGGGFVLVTSLRTAGAGDFRNAALLSIETGYWLWLASMGAALVAALLFPRSTLDLP